jgi:hypothetical protein
MKVSASALAIVALLGLAVVAVGLRYRLTEEGERRRLSTNNGIEL